MVQFFFVAIAGALGALSRWGISIWAARLTGAGFPFGTLTVNIIGCFVLGFLMHLSLVTDIIGNNIRVGLTVGFLGALTTFSTFSYETIKMLEEQMWMNAGLNIGGNLIIGLLATSVGLITARIFAGAG
jgi:CrcB protein